MPPDESANVQTHGQNAVGAHPICRSTLALATRRGLLVSLAFFAWGVVHYFMAAAGFEKSRSGTKPKYGLGEDRQVSRSSLVIPRCFMTLRRSRLSFAKRVVFTAVFSASGSRCSG